MAVVRVVQVAVVQVVGVPFVLHGQVAAAGAVDVRVVGVGVAVAVVASDRVRSWFVVLFVVVGGFAGVLQHGGKQVGHMPVCEGVEDVLPVAAASDEPLGPQGGRSR